MSLTKRAIILVTNHKFQVNVKFSNLRLAPSLFMLALHTSPKRYGLSRTCLSLSTTHLPHFNAPPSLPLGILKGLWPRQILLEMSTPLYFFLTRKLQRWILTPSYDSALNTIGSVATTIWTSGKKRIVVPAKF